MDLMATRHDGPGYPGVGRGHHEGSVADSATASRASVHPEEAASGQEGREEAVTHDDLPSVTGASPTPRMPAPPTADEPKGLAAKILIAALDAGLEVIIPIAIFLGLVGLMLL